MKIILVGATGFVGKEVLAQCLRKTSITSIVVLTRRPLCTDVSDDPKVDAIVVDDFINYSDAVKSKLVGATAAIWALRAATKEVELDYPLAFAEAIKPLLSDTKNTFRYMHLSGLLAEKDQEMPLWFLQEGRRNKGLAELKMRDVASKQLSQGPSWETYVARPSVVLPNPPGVLNGLMGRALGAIRVDLLAAAMIDVVENGSDQTTFENSDLVQRGTAVVAD